MMAWWSRTRTRRCAATAWLCAGAGLLVACGGCGEKDYYKAPAAEPEAAAQPATAPEAPSSDPLGSLRLGAGTAAESSRLTDEASGKDYTAKADVYWKLNWVKQVLERGEPPLDLPNALRIIRSDAAATLPDDKTPLIRSAADDVDLGLDAMAKEQRFRGAGLSMTSLPWGAGRYTMSESLAAARQAEPSTGAGSGAAARPSALEREILDFEETYHASPEQVKRSAFRRACATVERLGDALGLLDRPESGSALYGSGPGSWPRTGAGR